MELAISAAKPRLSELIAAAQRGERVIITKRGEPAVEMVACLKRSDDTGNQELEVTPVSIEQEPAGDFFERLAAAREQLGLEDVPPEEAQATADALHDSALSRRLLGVDDE